MRGYGQRDPLNEYKTEGFALFESMMTRLREMTTSQIIRVEIQQRPTRDMLPGEDDLAGDGDASHRRDDRRG